MKNLLKYAFDSYIHDIILIQCMGLIHLVHLCQLIKHVAGTEIIRRIVLVL